MKKLLLVVMFGFLASTVQAGCGTIEFKGTKPIVFRVDHISSVQYTGRNIVIRGLFGTTSFIVKKSEAINTYKRFRGEISACAKKGN